MKSKFIILFFLSLQFNFIAQIEPSIKEVNRTVISSEKIKVQKQKQNMGFTPTLGLWYKEWNKNNNCSFDSKSGSKTVNTFTQLNYYIDNNFIYNIEMTSYDLNVTCIDKLNMKVKFTFLINNFFNKDDFSNPYSFKKIERIYILNNKIYFIMTFKNESYCKIYSLGNDVLKEEKTVSLCKEGITRIIDNYILVCDNIKLTNFNIKVFNQELEIEYDSEFSKQELNPYSFAAPSKIKVFKNKSTDKLSIYLGCYQIGSGANEYKNLNKKDPIINYKLQVYNISDNLNLLLDDIDLDTANAKNINFELLDNGNLFIYGLTGFIEGSYLKEIKKFKISTTTDNTYIKGGLYSMEVNANGNILKKKITSWDDYYGNLKYGKHNISLTPNGNNFQNSETDYGIFDTPVFNENKLILNHVNKTKCYDLDLNLIWENNLNKYISSHKDYNLIYSQAKLPVFKDDKIYSTCSFTTNDNYIFLLEYDIVDGSISINPFATGNKILYTRLNLHIDQNGDMYVLQLYSFDEYVWHKINL